MIEKEEIFEIKPNACNPITGELAYVRQFTKEWLPICDYSKNSGVSVTVPGQTEPIAVTVKKCLRGDLTAIKSGFSDNDYGDFGDDLEPGFDLADINEAMEIARDKDMANMSKVQPVVNEPEKKQSEDKE